MKFCLHLVLYRVQLITITIYICIYINAYFICMYAMNNNGKENNGKISIFVFFKYVMYYVCFAMIYTNSDNII